MLIIYLHISIIPHLISLRNFIYMYMILIYFSNKIHIKCKSVLCLSHITAVNTCISS